MCLVLHQVLFYITFIKKVWIVLGNYCQIQGTNWKNCKRKFHNNKFSFKPRRWILFENKICSQFSRRALLHLSMFKLILHAKAKALVKLANNFSSHFIGHGITNSSKSWIKLQNNTVQEAALNPRLIFKTYLKVYQSSCFCGSWRKI